MRRIDWRATWGMGRRDRHARMVSRARWWHATGGIALAPTEAQLSAALQQWAPRSPLATQTNTTLTGGADELDVPAASWTADRIGLPWLGLPVPTPLLVAALQRSDRPATTRWLVQLLMPEPEVLSAVAVDLPQHAALVADARAMRSQAGLPAFLHRCAQIPWADLAWFARHDVRRPWPGRAWPPADDHFPTEVHGHRTVRALRGWSA